MAKKNAGFEVAREMVIAAPLEAVFSFFTQSERFAAWWGAGSTIEPRVGGAVKIVYPTKQTASGKVLEIEEPRRIVFSFGYDYPNPPIAPGASQVEIELKAHADGTALTLKHTGIPSEKVRGEHVQGWRYHLAQFSAAACKVAHSKACELCDAWFAAWNEKDEAKRAKLLRLCAIEGVEFCDAYSATRGIDDLVPHIGAAQMHMPGLTIGREGEPALSHGFALVRWAAKGPDGKAMGEGRNAIEFAPDGKFKRVVGYWGG